MTTLLEILMILGLGPLIWFTIRSGTLGSLTHPPKSRPEWTQYDALHAAQDHQLGQINAALIDRYSQLNAAYQQAQARYYSQLAERERQHVKR